MSHNMNESNVTEITQEEFLELYLKEIGSPEPVTEEEERELHDRVAQQDKAAVERLFISQLRLVVSIAEELRGYGVCLIDMIQEGNEALLQAAKSFGESESVCFKDYASRKIRNAIVLLIRCCNSRCHLSLEIEEPKEDPYHQMIGQIDPELLEECVNALRPINKDVMRLRFGMDGEAPLSRMETVQRLDTPVDRVRLAERAFLRMMRHLERRQRKDRVSGDS